MMWRWWRTRGLALSGLALAVVPWAQSFSSPELRTGSRWQRSARAHRMSLLPEVICVGDVLFDCIANDEARGWDIARVVDEEAWTAFPGGAPANVASALCKLGTPAGFAGCVGDDDDGARLKAELEGARVDLRLVHSTGDAPTRRVMVTRSLEGDRAFAGFAGGAKADAFADCCFDINRIGEDDWSTALTRVKWVVSSTLSLSFPRSARSVTMLVNEARRRGAKFFLDINWRDVFWSDVTEVSFFLRPSALCATA